MGSLNRLRTVQFEASRRPAARRLAGRFPVAPWFDHPPLGHLTGAGPTRLAAPHEGGTDPWAGVDHARSRAANVPGHNGAGQPGGTSLTEPVGGIDEALDGDRSGDRDAAVRDDPAPERVTRAGSRPAADTHSRQLADR